MFQISSLIFIFPFSRLLWMQFGKLVISKFRVQHFPDRHEGGSKLRNDIASVDFETFDKRVVESLQAEELPSPFHIGADYVVVRYNLLCEGRRSYSA